MAAAARFSLLLLFSNSSSPRKEVREKRRVVINFQGERNSYDQRVAFPRTEEELKRILLKRDVEVIHMVSWTRTRGTRSFVRENHRRGRGRGKEREYFYERGESGRGGTKSRACSIKRMKAKVTVVRRK